MKPRILNERSCKNIDALKGYGKNDFAEVIKNLTKYRYLRIILLNHQNNYVGKSNVNERSYEKLLSF